MKSLERHKQYGTTGLNGGPYLGRRYAERRAMCMPLGESNKHFSSSNVREINSLVVILHMFDKLLLFKLYK